MTAATLAAARLKLQSIMWLIVLEAALALAVMLFFVWWTMFAGRRHGEPAPDDEDDDVDVPGAQSPVDGGRAPERGGSRKLKG